MSFSVASRPGATSAAGCDHQRPVRTFKRRAEGFDSATVDLAVFREFREVVDEGEVDHAIRRGRSAPQAVQILQIAVMRVGAGGGQSLRTGLRTREAKHLMAGRRSVL